MPRKPSARRPLLYFRAACARRECIILYTHIMPVSKYAQRLNGALPTRALLKCRRCTPITNILKRGNAPIKQHRLRECHWRERDFYCPIPSPSRNSHSRLSRNFCDGRRINEIERRFFPQLTLIELCLFVWLIHRPLLLAYCGWCQAKRTVFYLTHEQVGQ
jgi:hypothetical protein